ncbi:MAG: cysteine peptidase family C39 domain-containing protein, partial [Pirellulales bacterium]|nr:cysteine peptidase family C39 domain-containing protein [Pirellulales bacterium]
PWPRGFPTGPWWNGGLFCGPNALYILMKLHEVPVELEEIHSQISIKPERGCTPHQLVDTGSKLGLPLEVRFVKATDLLEVQRPFILHGAQSEDREDAKGHFWVIVGYDEAARSFAVVDGSSGIYRFTSIAQVEKLFSGWVVVPKVTAAQSGWQISKVAFMSSLALVIVAGVYLLMLDDRVRRLNGQPQASTTAS